MTLTLRQQVQATAHNAAPDFDDDDIKDVFWPDFDRLPDETVIAFRLRYAFTCSGYRVKQVEEAKTHPVVILHAFRKDAEQISDSRSVFEHVRGVLRSEGFRLRKDELVVDWTRGS